MNIIEFKDCSYDNKNLVGGKCSSLGELYKLSHNLNFNIADGFALTTILYDKYIEQNKLNILIEETVDNLNYDDIQNLEDNSKKLIKEITEGTFKEEQIADITKYYDNLCNIFNQINNQMIYSTSLPFKIHNNKRTFKIFL